MPEAAHEQAFRAFMAHQAMLHAYVAAIVRDPGLAEDALSDVGIEVARSWAHYDQARPFAQWARGVARRVALASLRRWKRRSAPLDDQALECLAEGIEQLTADDLRERRGRALARCLEAVSGPNRELLHLRYADNLPPADIAARTGRTANALYVALHRLHAALADCIRRRIEAGA